MQLLCPTCSTVYEVPDAALAGRSRKLHCAQCGTDWRSEPLSPDLARVSGFEQVPQFEPVRENAMQAVDEIQAGEIQAGEPLQPFEPVAAQPVEPEVDPALGLPMFLRGGTDDDAPLHQPGQDDAFADLVHAARNNTVEYEPEIPPAPPPVKISNVPLVLTLVALLAVGLAGLVYLGHFGHIV